MSRESPPLSVRPVNPVDPLTARVLREIDRVARQQDCSYFVAGATARDLVLVHVFGLRPGRATRDIDFGFAVEDWRQFERFKKDLTATGQFRAHPHALQRLLFQSSESVEIPVDLIPFGGVTLADNTIAWPPHRDVVMNVSGFEEALASSVAIALDSDLTVRVASIPGLAVLKLVAWSDRGKTTNKDAADLYRLIDSY